MRLAEHDGEVFVEAFYLFQNPLKEFFTRG